MGYDKRMMLKMEEVRKSGVCNMYDRVCVCGELQDKHNIFVSRREYRVLFNEFVKYKESGE
jgi:hypothetical protein